MFYSLRVSLLLGMVTVAFVSILVFTVSAGLTTRNEFSRYVNIADTMQSGLVQQAVFTYWRTEGAREKPTPRPSDPRPNLLTAMTDGSDLYVIYSLHDVNRLPKSLNFTTQEDGTVQVRDGTALIGTLNVDPADEFALVPAQIDFVQSVNIGLLSAAGLAGMLAVVMTLFLSRQILQPVAALTQAARRLERGDLTQRVRISGSGELGELGNAFNAMAEAISTNEVLRRHMVTDVAHELRTPLTNIRGYLEAIQDGLIAPDRPTIDSIYEEALLLNHLIEDLQVLSLAEAGQLRYHKESLMLRDVVEQTVRMIQPSANAKEITIRVEMSSLPPVYADQNRIGQVLRNLLNNAVVHTPEQGHITVRVEARSDQVEVSVADTGEGIKAEHMPYIFERFYRADPSRSRATGGAGIGLSIVRRLVEGHSGHITVESEPGRGANFTFTLPVYQP
jgi:signal transduction histidine kinase